MTTQFWLNTLSIFTIFGQYISNMGTVCILKYIDLNIKQYQLWLGYELSQLNEKHWVLGSVQVLRNYVICNYVSI